MEPVIRISGVSVCRLLDIPYARFDSWKRKGRLPFDVQAGAWGTYGLREALMLAAAIELSGSTGSSEDSMDAVRRNSALYRDVVEGKVKDAGGRDVFHVFVNAVDEDGQRYVHQDFAFANTIPQLPDRHAEALLKSGINARTSSIVMLNLSGILDGLKRRAEVLGFIAAEAD